MKRILVPALMLVALPLAAAADLPEPGFTSLFNGKDLDGWHIENNGQFSVKDGVIFLNKGRGWLRSDKEYRDFELRLDFRFLSKGADSGIFVRASKEGNDWPARNYQIQTIDNPKSLGAIFGKANAQRNADKVQQLLKPTGEWQSMVITLQGDKLKVALNGETITEAEGLALEPNYIGLQGEGGVLEFKNIRIKELK